MRARLPQRAIVTSRIALRESFSTSIAAGMPRCGSRAFMVRDNGHRRPGRRPFPHHADSHLILRIGLRTAISRHHGQQKMLN